MTVTATIRAEYADPEQARLVVEAMKADDDRFAATRLEGSSAVAELSADSVRSLLRAADDFLSCLAVAEDVIKTPSFGRRNA